MSCFICLGLKTEDEIMIAKSGSGFVECVPSACECQVRSDYSFATSSDDLAQSVRCT